MKVGIIGFGSFGAFAARVLADYVQVVAWSDGTVESPYATSVLFEEVAAADVIILAVPLAAYESVLTKLKPLLNPQAVVVDICSVKVQSRDTLLRVLAGHEHLLVTHPLFGPESAATSTAGHTLIVCEATSERAEECVAFCEQRLQLQVTRIDAEQHDRVMAYVHVLTFFVARGLGRMNMPEIPFKTPSFNELMDLVRLDQKHSDELFATVQQGNPYGEAVRQDFLRTLADLEQSITGD